jgi:hypothetical protein
VVGALSLHVNSSVSAEAAAGAEKPKGQSVNEQAELCDTGHPILTFSYHHSLGDIPALGHSNRVPQRLLKHTAIAA